MGRLSLLLIGLVLGLAAFVVPSLAADYTKPGPFAVGLQKFTIPDVTGKHPMFTMVWYPAAGPAPNPTVANPMVTPDSPGAVTGPYPLVVLIHGLDGRGVDYGALGELLASHGFVVAAANFDSGLSGPLEAGVRLEDRPSVWLLYDRPANVVRVIGYADTLTAPGGKLAGIINTSRIGVWGHSTGGTTAFQAAGAQIDFKALDAWCSANQQDSGTFESCQFVGHEQAVAAHYGVAEPFAAPLPPVWDNRVAVLVTGAPGGELHAFGDKGIAAVKVPALIMFASDDHMVLPKYNAMWAYDGIGSEDKALAVFDRGGHVMFASALSPKFHTATALATAFFLDILKDDAAGRATLMPDASPFPGLSYNSTLH